MFWAFLVAGAFSGMVGMMYIDPDILIQWFAFKPLCVAQEQAAQEGETNDGKNGKVIESAGEFGSVERWRFWSILSRVTNCKESHGQLSLPHQKHTAFRKRISLTCGCFGKLHLCKMQRSHDFIGKPSPICWNTGAMGIFWSHEFTPKKGCFFLSFIGPSGLNEILSTSTLTGIPYQGTFEDFPNFPRWDFQMTNGLDGRIQLLPRVAVRGAPPSVALRPSATGCNGRRRSEDGGCCDMTKCAIFFSSTKKRRWWFFEGCHTAMLPCFFLLFSSFFWVLVLHFGSFCF